MLALTFTQIADELGDPRVANMVMLGALLEITGALPQASIDAALHRLVKHQNVVSSSMNVPWRVGASCTASRAAKEVVP